MKPILSLTNIISITFKRLKRGFSLRVSVALVAVGSTTFALGLLAGREHGTGAATSTERSTAPRLDPDVVHLPVVELLDLEKGDITLAERIKACAAGAECEVKHFSAVPVSPNERRMLPVAGFSSSVVAGVMTNTLHYSYIYGKGDAAKLKRVTQLGKQPSFHARPAPQTVATNNFIVISSVTGGDLFIWVPRPGHTTVVLHVQAPEIVKAWADTFDESWRM